MPVFSIIIPIHNAQETLSQCLDSLLRQSFPDFEVCMVENGSTDASLTICQRYAERDRRFRLFVCNPGRGPSGARNRGLDEARGQYIAFVDSDDFVAPPYLDQLYSAFAHQADVVFFGYKEVGPDGSLRSVRIPSIPETLDFKHTLMELSRLDLFGYAWCKAFRADVIGSVRFPQTLNLMEDEVFSCEVLKTGQNLEILPQALYFYKTGNSGSLMGRTHPDFCQKLDVVYDAWNTLLADCQDRTMLQSQRAQAYVCKCMYYGFERSLDPISFFSALSQCQFFADIPHNTPFARMVAEKNWFGITLLRLGYRIKVSASHLLRR